MSWVRLDDGFMTHPKVLALTDAELRLHLLALCYSAKFSTDGFISKAVDKQIRATKRPRLRHRSSLALVNAGVWEVVDGGYMIHDYLDYNLSRKQVEHQQARWRRYKASTAESKRTSTADPHDPSPIPSMNNAATSSPRVRDPEDFAVVTLDELTAEVIARHPSMGEPFTDDERANGLANIRALRRNTEYL